MIRYRIQYSDGHGWILRHPDFTLPMLADRDKQKLIDSLPDFFAKRKETATVFVKDEYGRDEEEKNYPYVKQ